MLTRLIARSDVVAESGAVYNAGVEYEYREAEYEYEDDRKPEPSRAPKTSEACCLGWDLILFLFVGHLFHFDGRGCERVFHVEMSVLDGQGLNFGV